MRYYIIAGEASGDLHGSNLMKELKKADEKAEFRFFGGDLMQAVGGDLVKHYREMAFMGIVNVLLNLKTIKNNMDFCKKDLMEFKPDVLILIDYPGFNLLVAEFAKKNNIKVFYYISPKIWAWKERRIKKIKAFVDEMFVIFPFETSFYRKHGMEVHYVGNPLFDSIAGYRQNVIPKEEFLQKNGLNEKPLVALLAGSRVQEIKRCLPLMLEIARLFPDFQFVVAGVNSISRELYDSFLKNAKVKIIFGQTYDLLNNSHAALVASGTAALETALFHVPQTVIYKVEGGWLLDIIFRNFMLKTIGVALPNIILNELIVKEFIQMKMTLKNVQKEMKKLLYDDKYRDKIKADYTRLENLMGEKDCSERAAIKILEKLAG